MTEAKTHTIRFDEGGQKRELLLAHAHFDNSVVDNLSWLAGDEIKTYESFKAVSRKNEYLAGRVLAKKAVLQTDKTHLPSDIEIATALWGYPLFKTKYFSDYWLSIAYTTTEVAVLLSQYNTHPVGLDVEQISEENQNVLQQFLSKYGRAFSLQDMHLYWSAKEAASKALRTGFTVPEPLFEIEEVKEIGGKYEIKFKNLQRLQAVAWIQNDVITCIAYPIEWAFTHIDNPNFFEDIREKVIKTTDYD